MSQFNSRDFKKLQSKWYAKIKKHGFEDAETLNGKLKISARQVLRKSVLATKQSKEDYTAMADDFLHSHSFKNELEKIIWEYHANGLGAPAIAETLRKAKITKTNRTTVAAIIDELKVIMKAKYLKVNNE